MSEAAAGAAPAAVVEDVAPQVDGGRFAIKRVVGEEIEVTAACFAHGHEQVACAVRCRPAGEPHWREIPMTPLGNDRWRARFTVDRAGPWEYVVLCWVDHLRVWHDDFVRRVEPEDIRLAARTGAELLAHCIELAKAPGRERLVRAAATLRAEQDVERLRAAAMDEALIELACACAPRDGLVQAGPYAATVDRVRARFGSWYEIFPRSCSATSRTARHVRRPRGAPGRDRRDGLRRGVPAAHPPHRAREAQGQEQRDHLGRRRRRQPLGHRQRRGRPHRDPSGAGHRWRTSAGSWPARASRGMEIALDIAFQCAPDHPWVARAPRMVPQAPRRQHPVRREPAQEVPGHLSARLRHAPRGRSSGTRCATSSCTGSKAGRARSSASTIPTPSPSRSGNG